MWRWRRAEYWLEIIFTVTAAVSGEFWIVPQNITGPFQPNDTHFWAFRNRVAPSPACWWSVPSLRGAGERMEGRGGHEKEGGWGGGGGIWLLKSPPKYRGSISAHRHTLPCIFQWSRPLFGTLIALAITKGLWGEEWYVCWGGGMRKGEGVWGGGGALDFLNLPKISRVHFSPTTQTSRHFEVESPPLRHADVPCHHWGILGGKWVGGMSRGGGWGGGGGLSSLFPWEPPHLWLHPNEVAAFLPLIAASRISKK